MVSTCTLPFSSFLCRAVGLSPFSSGQRCGGLLLPLPLGGQRRASASSSFTPAPFHRSCYKKHNNLEFDSLPGACWKLAGGQTSLLPCSVLLPFSPVHVQGPRWQISGLLRSSSGGSVQGVFSAS